MRPKYKYTRSNHSLLRAFQARFHHKRICWVPAFRCFYALLLPSQGKARFCCCRGRHYTLEGVVSWGLCSHRCGFGKTSEGWAGGRQERYWGFSYLRVMRSNNTIEIVSSQKKITAQISTGATNNPAMLSKTVAEHPFLNAYPANSR